MGDTTMILTKKQREILDEVGVDTSDWKRIDGKQLHQYMVGAEAWTDGEYLVFIDQDTKSEARFIYYAGAERSAVLIARLRGVSVYENAGEGLLERLMGGKSEDEDEDEDEESIELRSELGKASQS